MSKQFEFDEQASVRYLGLPLDYQPSPKADPIAFLAKHVTQLPPHILPHYSLITTPKQRTVIPAIRNRRVKYTTQSPKELSFVRARNTWPHLWDGRERPGVDERNEEQQWAAKEFMQGGKQHIGKLGNLLGDFEEERENERVRALRRIKEADDFVPEEDTDSEEEEEEEEEEDQTPAPESETPAERQASFERRIRERFIYGMLDEIDYDKVDWDETLDADEDRETEDRWFDEDDED